MEKKSILNVLKSNDITDEHIKLFSEKLKDKNFGIDQCDKLLVKLGYEKLFSFDDDFEEDDFDSYDDFEPISHKKTFEE